MNPESLEEIAARKFIKDNDLTKEEFLSGDYKKLPKRILTLIEKLFEIECSCIYNYNSPLNCKAIKHYCICNSTIPGLIYSIQNMEKYLSI